MNRIVFMMLLMIFSSLFLNQLIGQNSYMTDIDGNKYLTVRIGNQEWMAENLRVTHYRNGDTIALVEDAGEWEVLRTGAYSWYNNDEQGHKTLYGALYNWYALDDPRGLCPEGWRVPAEEDWNELIAFLGRESVAGGRMKEAGTAHWNSPNTHANNESGFTALPGGYRFSNGKFDYLGQVARWWTATPMDGDNAWFRNIGFFNISISKHLVRKEMGLSVRCLKSD